MNTSSCLGSKIYIYGGSSNQQETSDFWEFDTFDNSFRVIDYPKDFSPQSKMNSACCFVGKYFLING